MRGRIDDFTFRRDAPPMRTEIGANHGVTTNAAKRGELSNHRSGSLSALEFRGFRRRVSLGNPRAEQVIHLDSSLKPATSSNAPNAPADRALILCVVFGFSCHDLLERFLCFLKAYRIHCTWFRIRHIRGCSIALLLGIHVLLWFRKSILVYLYAVGIPALA